MQEAISHAYQAGIEIGRAAAKQEMEQIAKITAAYAEHAANAPVSVFKNRGVVKVTPGRTPTKHPTVASGVKKGRGPRTPGVKAAILAMIASEAMSAAAIIAKTGFKDTSVRGTLMTLKKAGLIMNDDGLWIAASHASGGNSESDPYFNVQDNRPGEAQF